jgi:anti-anti-sigma factor
MPSPQAFQIEAHESASGALVLRLTGALTIQTLFDFQTTVRSESSRALLLDFAGVPYMDSAGLGSVINAFTACQRASRGFAATGICDRIKTLFAVTHMEGIIPCFASFEAAEASLDTSSD